MTAIRRLAAILAADVAGYSRLMGVDEEGTLERLKALRRQLVDPKIAEHHGRIVKTTGDGVRDRLPFAFEDLGEQQVKKIARLVRIYRVHDIGVAKSRSAPALPLPDKPSIAVLPFANISGIGPVPSVGDGSLDIALNEFPMRDLRKDLSCAAHECAVRRRIETQAIGHPRGGVAKIAINADQAGRRGCGIAARLARNVIMRWTDQRCGQFGHGVRYGGVERGKRLFAHLLWWLQLDRRRDRNIVGAVDEEHRSVSDACRIQHLIRRAEAELLSGQFYWYDRRNSSIGCEHRANGTAGALGMPYRADVVRIELVEKDAAGVAVRVQHKAGRIPNRRAVASESIPRRHDHEAP
jgi:hypothetical protein